MKRVNILYEYFESSNNGANQLSNESTTTLKSDFCLFCATKAFFLENLEVIGTFTVLGISQERIKNQQQVHKLDIDNSDLGSDSDYDEEIEDKVESDENLLDNYFHSDNNAQQYEEPPMTTFSKHRIIIGTNASPLETLI